MKTALITGITGQDGSYLAQFLLEKGYRVYGSFRRSSTPNFWRLNYLDIFDRIKFIPMDLTDHGSIVDALLLAQPDEIYHLAAQSFVEASFQTPVSTAQMTGVSVVALLEAIRAVTPDCRFYFAATSEMFGGDHSRLVTKLDEESPFRPVSPYAAAKLFGFWSTETYRRAYNLFACSGILFNHESPIRGLEFVTRKIANEVARVALGISREIRLGNITAERDWGYAPEYVKAMWMMLQAEVPRNYVVATGESHSVREFLDLACAETNIRPEPYLKIDKLLTRPIDVPSLLGNPSRIAQDLRWHARTDFHQLVQIMVCEEVRRWERYLKGEMFPWDVPGYPHRREGLKRRGRKHHAR